MPKSLAAPSRITIRVDAQVVVDENGNPVSVLGKAASSHRPRSVGGDDDDDDDQQRYHVGRLAIPHSLFRRLSTSSHMSLPRSNYDHGKHKRTSRVYLAGALFAIGNWTFLDAAISAHWGQPPVHFDWTPGICSFLGYVVISMGFGDSRAVWRARVFLFVGFALMAGGLASSVTRLDRYSGYANVCQSLAMMLSAVLLWM